MKFYQHDFLAMTCPASIQVYSSSNAESLLIACEEEAERFNKKYSTFLPNSLLSNINSTAADQAVNIDEETYQILSYAGVCHEISQGLFDVTAGPILDLWHSAKDRAPDNNDIQKALDKVGWQHIKLKEGSVFFQKSGMKINLDGVIKEYAADAIANFLKNAGIKHGTINLAGDICVIGPRADGSPWQIGISQPGHYEEAIAYIEMDKGSITTSGSEERYIKIGDKKYNHLISPITGIPLKGLKSVTILAGQTITAGSLSSIAMLKETKAALTWLDKLGLPYFAVDQNDQSWGSIFKAKH